MSPEPVPPLAPTPPAPRGAHLYARLHPAHQAANSWREFLIHIAAIVIGLAIAVGFEQTVEFLHHRHQIRQTRERLHKEIEVNIGINQENLHYADEMAAHMDRNMAILGTPESGAHVTNGELRFGFEAQAEYDSAF